MDLRDRILELIDKRGLTNAEFLRLTKVKESTFYMFLKRNTELQLETLRPIAKALDVSLDYLIYGEEKKPNEKFLSLDTFYEACQTIGLTSDKLNKLSDKQKELFAGMLDEMIKKGEDKK